MSRLLTLAGIGLLAGSLILAAPTSSQAQGYGPGARYAPSYGGHGPGYTPGYGYGDYRAPVPDYRGYAPESAPGHGYGGFLPRPTIVHPRYEHWTPWRGWHEHGHLHIPHRGHYHTRPY